MIATTKSLTPAPAEPHDHAHAHHGHLHPHAHGHHHPAPATQRIEPRLPLIALSGLQRLGLVLPAIGVLWLLTFWAMSHA